MQLSNSLRDFFECFVLYLVIRTLHSTILLKEKTKII